MDEEHLVGFIGLHEKHVNNLTEPVVLEDFFRMEVGGDLLLFQVSDGGCLSFVFFGPRLSTSFAFGWVYPLLFVLNL